MAGGTLPAEAGAAPYSTWTGTTTTGRSIARSTVPPPSATGFGPIPSGSPTGRRSRSNEDQPGVGTKVGYWRSPVTARRSLRSVVDGCASTSSTTSWRHGRPGPSRHDIAHASCPGAVSRTTEDGPVVSPGARESRTPSVDPVCVPVIAAFRVGGPGCPLGIRMALSLSFASSRTASVAWPAAIVTSRAVEACSLPVVGVAKGGFTVSQIRPTNEEDRQDRDQHARALQEHDDGSPRVMEHGRPRP